LQDELRKFKLQELRQYDGRDGRPAYIAYKGKVYDVTDSYLWIGGDHQGAARGWKRPHKRNSLSASRGRNAAKSEIDRRVSLNLKSDGFYFVENL